MTQADELAEKIVELLNADDPPYIFSSDEVKDLQALIAVLRFVRRLGWFGAFLLWLIPAVGACVAVWDRLKDMGK